MPKISPFLWFDTQAEEAAAFYVSIFPNSQIVTVARYGGAGPGPKAVMEAMLQMTKIDIPTLERAYRGA